MLLGAVPAFVSAHQASARGAHPGTAVLLALGIGVGLPILLSASWILWWRRRGGVPRGGSFEATLGELLDDVERSLRDPLLVAQARRAVAGRRASRARRREDRRAPPWGGG